MPEDTVASNAGHQATVQPGPWDDVGLPNSLRTGAPQRLWLHQITLAEPPLLPVAQHIRSRLLTLMMRVILICSFPFFLAIGGVFFYNVLVQRQLPAAILVNHVLTTVLFFGGIIFLIVQHRQIAALKWYVVVCFGNNFVYIWLTHTAGSFIILAVSLILPALIFSARSVVTAFAVASGVLFVTVYIDPLLAKEGVWFGTWLASGTLVAVMVGIGLGIRRLLNGFAETIAAREGEVAARARAEAHAEQAGALATERERTRIAREIHDGLGHYFTGIHAQLQASLRLLDTDRQRSVSAISNAVHLANVGLNEVRLSVKALRAPSIVPDRPLSETIDEILAMNYTGGLTVHLDVLGEPRQLDVASYVALCRAAQEGLTNVRKHAQATSVTLQLDYSASDRVRLIMHDNGTGAVEPSVMHRGFGLVGMSERIRALGGTVDWQSIPGQGFRLEVEVPR